MNSFLFFFIPFLVDHGLYTLVALCCTHHESPPLARRICLQPQNRNNTSQLCMQRKNKTFSFHGHTYSHTRVVTWRRILSLAPSKKGRLRQGKSTRGWWRVCSRNAWTVRAPWGLWLGVSAYVHQRHGPLVNLSKLATVTRCGEPDAVQNYDGRWR
jgi:hypothetical protein